MLSVHRLIWDTWNVAHIARHDITSEEVEGVCHGKPVTSETRKGRIRVVGLTQSGRILTVILASTQEEGVYYPITARPADRKERRNYHQV
ncbi:MAG: hypothetical protein Q8R39_00295 [bacterium]|nr:hypothetical protein [bacterium]MDZ4284683.1 hypothetical protein [Patescibacteria group bacterium]